MKGPLKRSRMVQISASQHLPVRSYRTAKNESVHVVKVVMAVDTKERLITLHSKVLCD